MTDNSANPRNQGEPSLHEDDPLMELSRIMDFGSPVEHKSDWNERAEPEFGAINDPMDFDGALDLERELLGDFDEPEQPVQAIYQQDDFQQEHIVSENTTADQYAVQSTDHDLAAALDEEFALGLDMADVDSAPEVFEFVEPDHAEPVPEFEYTEHAPVEAIHAHDVNSHVEPVPSDQPASSHWELPMTETVAPFVAPAPLSLEDELESLLFGDEPQQDIYTGNFTEQEYQTEPAPQQYFAEPATPEYVAPFSQAEPEPDFADDEFGFDEPDAAPAYVQEAVIPAYFPTAENEIAEAADGTTSAYPHYTRGNFAPDVVAATPLVADYDTLPAQHLAEPEMDPFSFDDVFSLNSEELETSLANEATEDDFSTLENIELSDDDFGFEASGDTSAPLADDQLVDDDFFSVDDFALEDTALDMTEPVQSQAYAHATYSDDTLRAPADTPSFLAGLRSNVSAPVPEIETISVADNKVEQTHSLDLPEVNYTDNEPNAGLTDLEAEFAEVFNTIGVDENAVQTGMQSEADKAFDDIFRESVASYLPDQVSTTNAAALGLGAAAAATVAFAKPNASVTPNNSGAISGGQDDFYNHWAQQGAQPIEDDQFGARAAMQSEDDLGSAAEAYRNRPVRGRRGLILASVAGIAVLIGGIGYHFLQGDSSSEPVVIRADNQPVKMQPENPGGAVVPNQDKAVYDRVAGTLPNNPEQKSLISSQDKPVDLETTLPAEPEEVPLIQPREVETMIVRPDGSIIRSQSDDTSANMTDTAPQPGAGDVQPSSTMDEIAALAADSNDAPLISPPVETTPVDNTPVVDAPQLPVRAPIVPSRPAQQPVTVVGNVQQRTPTVADTTPAQQVASTGGGYFIQIASLPTAEAAQSTYTNMAQKYASVIGGRGVDIKRADIPGKGTYYRVRVQAGTKNDANALCSRFKSAGGSCLVTQ